MSLRCCGYTAVLGLLLLTAAVAPAAAQGRGDLNGDGRVSVPDVLLALKLAAGMEPATAQKIALADVSPFPNGDGRVGMDDVLRILRFAAGLLPADQFYAPTVLPGVSPSGVPRMLLQDPVAGYSVIIPQDWGAGTSLSGLTTVGLPSPMGWSSLQPQFWVFYGTAPPEQEIQGLALGLQAAAQGAVPVVRATGVPGEWEASVTVPSYPNNLVQRFVCHPAGAASHVIGSLATPQVDAENREDLSVALSTCQPIASVATTLFREPTENAYTLRLPAGWQFVAAESGIYRSELIPGFFVMKSQSADGRSGCFIGLPGEYPFWTDYQTAETAARGTMLDRLKQAIPDVQLVGLQPFTRSNTLAEQELRTLGFEGPREDRSMAVYRGTLQGAVVRVVVDITTRMYGALAVLGGRGNWNLLTVGVWAPEADFEQQGSLARGVLASLKPDREWTKRQQKAVEDVLDYRSAVMENLAEKWIQYIRQ